MIIDLQEIAEKYIDDSLNDSEKAVEVLENAFSSSYHFPKLKMKTYYKLLEKNKTENFLSRKASNKLNTIYNNSTKILSEIDNIPSTIKIVENTNQYDEMECIFIIPLNEVEETIFEQTHFLVENIKDSRIYLMLSEMYLKYQNKNLFKLNFYFDNGSGNQIGNQYEISFVEQKKVGICVADSDKKYPRCEYGNTVNCLLTKKKDDVLCELIILKHQREIENFIPLSILEIMYNKLFKRKNQFNNILSDMSDKFYNYMDIKNGIKIKDMLNNDFFNFWKEIFEEKELNCEFSYKINETSNTLNVDLRTIEDIKEFIESKEFLELKGDISEFSKNEIKRIEEIEICKGYGEKITDMFLDFLNKETLIKEEIENLKENINIPKARKEIAIEKKENKIKELREKKSEIFKNKYLIEVLEKIIYWGIEIRNIEKIS